MMASFNCLNEARGLPIAIFGLLPSGSTYTENGATGG